MFGFFCAWCLLMAGVSIYVLQSHRQTVLQIARHIAAETLDRDLVYRRWVTRCGGVYAPVSDWLRPDPWLEGLVENRDITTPSGKLLTLVNPTYMTRMVYDIFRKEKKSRNHITSLKPLCPENRPDAREKQALHFFVREGVGEFSEIGEIDGQPALFFMRRLPVEKPCLKCHIRHGHQAGNIRGGISIWIPLTPLELSLRPLLKRQMLIFLAIFLLGLLGLWWVYLRLKENFSRIRDQERWLLALLNSSVVGIGQVTNRVITNVNSRCCEILGYEKSELLEENTRFLYPDEENFQKVGELYSNPGRSIEIMVRRKDGKLVDLLLTASHLTGCPADGTIFTMVDVSDRKQVERKLWESEKKFRGMMEVIRDPILIYSQQRRIEYVNPAMIETIGKDCTGDFCYRALHGIEQPCPECHLDGVINGKSLEGEISYPKGSCNSYLVSLVPLEHGNGTVSVLAVFKDITEINEMKKRLYQAQKMESIGILAGGVAHDFNNILTVIRGHAEMGMMSLEADNKIYQDFAAIERAGARARQLVSQLLAFSRKQRINPRPLVLIEVVHELYKMLRRLIDEDITIEITSTGRQLPILADQGQIEQVIINLVVNAADAIRSSEQRVKKTISLSVATATLADEFVAHHPDCRPGFYICMTVTDTGCGMNAETRERIFEPFYTTKEIGRGTGLGLATVYGIVSQNQGCIEVESEPGKGSTFKVYWPVLEKEEKVTTNLEEEDWTKLPGGSETILVVEDDAAVREIACRHLRRAGYQVIEAENGAQALDLIAVGGGRDIDLVFTDIVMPVLDGWELEHRVREHYPEIRILFATGYFDEHLRDAAAGALSSRDILDKPYQPGELLRRIRQILDTSVG